MFSKPLNDSYDGQPARCRQAVILLVCNRTK